MLLAIDAGNTNVCFALFKQSELVYTWRARTNSKYTADEWAVWLGQLLKLHNLSFEDIKETILCSVVPDLVGSLQEFCRHYINSTPLVVGNSSINLGILSKIDRPGEEGADMMVNAVAAHTLYGGPLLVIDFGTATTMSFIDADGNFCGTAIAPGVNCSLDALYNAAAKLPMISISRPKYIIGTNTVDSMMGGIFWGYVAMIEGLVSRARRECVERFNAQQIKVIATGGLGGLIKPATDVIDIYNPNLTLSGLAIIHERNK
ncbi:MAG: pantothenate kinase [Caedibacter sp. 38-128]|nr:type III pantothenate kinase [Holosporales bacterium]OJX03540.1 MAG: pantothenate kinase [Caedibacter sp. 38-128]